MNTLGLDDTLTLLADKTILLSLMADRSKISHLLYIQAKFASAIQNKPRTARASKVFNFCFDCINAALSRLNQEKYYSHEIISQKLHA